MALHTKEVAEIKVIQNTLDKCQKEIMTRIKKLHKQVTSYVQKEWNKIFPGINVHFLTGFGGGCHTKNWEPEVWFYHFNDIEPYKGKFYKATYNENDWSLDAKIEEVDAPIPMKNLRNFLKRISGELGIPCSLVDSWHVRHAIISQKCDKITKNNKSPE